MVDNGSVTPSEAMRTPHRRSQLLRFLRLLVSVRLAGFGLVIVTVMLFAAVTADFTAPFDPLYQNYDAVLQPPSFAHPMGTDHLGRDMLSRIIYGSRVSAQVGIFALMLAIGCGVVIGMVAGYSGGLLDDALMRVMDAVQAFPGILLTVAITGILGVGLDKVIIAIGFVRIPAFARLVRAQTLSAREQDYVLSARAVGVPTSLLLRRHMLPNVITSTIVQGSLSIGGAIIAEAGLSFLGFGVAVGTPTWGSMLRDGSRYIDRAPWISIFTGGILFITVLAFNFLGDGLRVALDPRLR